MEQSEPPEIDHQLARGVKNRPGPRRERLCSQSRAARAAAGVFAAGDESEPAAGVTGVFRSWMFIHIMFEAWTARRFPKPNETKAPSWQPHLTNSRNSSAFTLAQGPDPADRTCAQMRCAVKLARSGNTRFGVTVAAGAKPVPANRLGRLIHAVRKPSCWAGAWS